MTKKGTKGEGVLGSNFPGFSSRTCGAWVVVRQNHPWVLNRSGPRARNVNLSTSSMSISAAVRNDSGTSIFWKKTLLLLHTVLEP